MDKKTISYGIVSIFLLTAVLVLFGYSKTEFFRNLDGTKESFLYIGLTLIVIGWVIENFKEFHKEIVVNLWDVLICSYLAYVLLRTVFAGSHQYESFVYFGCLSILYFSARGLSILSRENLLLLAKGLVLFVFIAQLWCFFEFMLSGFQPQNLYLMLPVGHVSYYSDILLFALPVSYYFFCTSKSNVQRLGFGFLSVFFSVMLWLLATKSSLVGLVVALCALAFILVTRMKLWNSFAKHKRRHAALLLAIVALISLTEVFSISYRDMTMFERVWVYFQEQNSNLDHDKKIKKETASKVGRVDLFRGSMKGIVQKPLHGWGFQSFQYVYPIFIEKYFGEKSILESSKGKWMTHPHSEVLKQLFDGGVLGVLLFLSAFFSAIYVLWKNRDDAFTLTMLVSALAFFVSFQFSPGFVQAVNRVFLVFIAAIVFQQKTWKVWSYDSQKKWISIVSAPIIVLSIYFSVGDRIAEYLLKNGYAEMKEQKHTELHKAAQQWSPLGFYTLFYGTVFEAQMGNLAQAESLAIIGVNHYPYTTILHHKLGLIYLNAGRTQDAQKVLAWMKRVTPLQELNKDLEKNILKSLKYQKVLKKND